MKPPGKIYGGKGREGGEEGRQKEGGELVRGEGSWEGGEWDLGWQGRGGKAGKELGSRGGGLR